jgi:hypothetical protein
VTVSARLLWVVVAVSLLAGGSAIAVTGQARSVAAEEHADVTKRLDALKAEAKEQPGEISRLTEDRKDRVELARECLVVIALQNRALNQLVRGMGSGAASRSELDVYADRARDLLIGFRQILDDCQGT